MDRWVPPNPFVTVLHRLLKDKGVELADFSFNRDAANIGDVYLTLSIRRHNAEVKIGLDTLTYSVANPDWRDAPDLVSIFEQIASAVCDIVRLSPQRQETTLVLHVRSESVDFRATTAALVNQVVLGEAGFYGVNIHRSDGSLTIDKSLRHQDGVFIRIQRKFSGEESFSEVASAMYENEVSALRLLGLTESERKAE